MINGGEIVLAPTVIWKPVRDNKPYRLRCRFQVEPYPSRGRLDREKVLVAERFVRDMHKQGWEHRQGGFTMTGPYPKINVTTLHRPRRRSAREMLAGVKEGRRFRDEGIDQVQAMPPLAASEYWEYELASVFARPEILTELPSPHEERGNA